MRPVNDTRVSRSPRRDASGNEVGLAFFLLHQAGQAGGGGREAGSGVRACDERAGATSTAFSYGFLIRSVRRVAHACLRPSQVSQSTQFVRAKNQKETQWIEGDFDGA